MDPITTMAIINGVTGMAGMAANASANKMAPLQQQGMQMQLMKYQYDLNKEAMGDQERTELRMFENTGYGARVKQMKEAGLNPGLIYGTGASGGGGTTGNITAPQVSGGNAPNMASFNANNIASQGMMLQLAKLASEIKVNESVAEANKAQAEITSGVETQKRTEEVTGIQYDNAMKAIDTEIKTKAKDANVELILTNLEQAKTVLDKTISESSSANANARVDQASINARINQYNADVQKTIADTIVAKSQNQVNLARATEIANEISQKWQELKLKNTGQAIDVERIENEMNMTLINNASAMDRVNRNAIWKMVEKIIPNTFVSR